jgi:hypothetical protein
LSRYIARPGRYWREEKEGRKRKTRKGGEVSSTSCAGGGGLGEDEPNTWIVTPTCVTS